MKMKLFLVGLAIACSGCGATAKFVYPSNTKNLVQLSEKARYAKEVAVLPFEEMRGDSNNYGTVFLYLIPLMPFGYLEYQRPDAATSFVTINRFDFNVSEDLAKAAATSIRRAGLFMDCYFTFGGEKNSADLLFGGQVKSTTYEGALYTYGLSILGPDLWFLGLPVGSSVNELVINFELRDAKTREKIWEYAYANKKKIIHGWYYNRGHDARGYVELMEEAMNGALVDMDKKLRARFDGS